MKRHAALPYFENFQRIGKIVGVLIKQHIAKPPAHNHADDAPGEEVVQRLRGEHAVALADAPPPEPHKQGEADEVADGIPADGERAELEHNGIESGMDQHRENAAETKGRIIAHLAIGR